MNLWAKIAMSAVGISVLCLVGDSASVAGPDENKLQVDGVEILTDAKAPAEGPLDHLYSGWRFRSAETQALQTDDFENPGFAAITLAEELWETPEGAAGKSCSSCHEDAETSMKGVRAAMPKWSEARGKPHTLETQINECRTERMQADKWKWEAPEMLGMTAYVGLQSRGMPITVQTDGPMKAWQDKGEELYYTRVGQLNMSCANCHENNYGQMIRADHLSQGHVNGFPVYRLKWGGLGSIHRRFKGCMENIRATPFKRGDDEFIALEAYVAARGKGLAIETPAVRN